MLGHISKFDGNNSLIKHDVVQGNNKLDLDLLRNFNGVPGLNRDKEGANKRGNSSRLTQSFHFFMFEPIFSPVNALNQPI